MKSKKALELPMNTIIILIIVVLILILLIFVFTGYGGELFKILGQRANKTAELVPQIPAP